VFHASFSLVVGGKKLASYDGNWGDMDDDFKEELELLIAALLSPDKLVVKQINGKSLDSSEYLAYVEQYLTLFKSNELPEAQTIYESTVEKQLQLVVDTCFDRYKELIEQTINLVQSSEQIPIFHENSMNAALIKFKETKKMGNAGHSRKFEQQLTERMQKMFEQWSSQTEEGLRRLREEQEKTRLATLEKERLYREQIAAEKRAVEKAAALDKLRHDQAITKERYESEKKLAQQRLEAEKARRQEMEDRKQEDEAYRERMMIEIERLNEEIQKHNRPPPPRKKKCIIL
jgi:hypothetical protein